MGLFAAKAKEHGYIGSKPYELYKDKSYKALLDMYFDDLRPKLPTEEEIEDQDLAPEETEAIESEDVIDAVSSQKGKYLHLLVFNSLQRLSITSF